MSGALPREHGTQRGYNQHYRLGEEICPECQEGNKAAARERRAAKRAELEARRERWRQAEAEAPS